MNAISDETSTDIEKSAVIGITGIKKLFFDTYIYLSNNTTQRCDKKEEALDYLAE